MVHLFREINALKKQLMSLGDMVEKALQNAVTAFDTRDFDMAEQVIAFDATVDQMEIDIEENCLKMLALYQPVANDLRFIVAVLKINNDLERIGDLAANIAKNASFVLKFPRPEIHPHVSVEEVGARAMTMLKNALDSLINMDASFARTVRQADDEVDEMVRNLQNLIKAEIRKNPGQTDLLIAYINVCKHLERIADLATNIAEDTIYMKDGIIVRHEPPATDE